MGGLKLILSWFPIGTHQILPLIASLGWPGGRSPTFYSNWDCTYSGISRSRSVLKKGLGKKVGMNNCRALFQLVMFGLFVSARVESELMRAHSVIWWGVYFFWTVRLPFFLASFKFFFFSHALWKRAPFCWEVQNLLLQLSNFKLLESCHFIQNGHLRRQHSNPHFQCMDLDKVIKVA